MESYVEWTRKICLSLPHATEKVRWEHNLLFCIGEKMFCIANLDPAISPGRIGFKCTPEKFAELAEIEGLIPAPYLARNHWISVQDMNALRRTELDELIFHSYRLVLERLPKRTQAALAGDKPSATTKRAQANRPEKPASVKARSKPKRASRRKKSSR